MSEKNEYVVPRLSPGHQTNFDTLVAAVKAGDVCLMSCLDRQTLDPVAVICAVHHEGEQVVTTPFAVMFRDNPYEELIPPGEAEEMQAAGTLVRKEGPYERLFKAANDKEWPLIEEVAVRAGIVWRCENHRPGKPPREPPSECGWVNPENQVKCGGCGADKPESE